MCGSLQLPTALGPGGGWWGGIIAVPAPFPGDPGKSRGCQQMSAGWRHVGTPGNQLANGMHWVWINNPLGQRLRAALLKSPPECRDSCLPSRGSAQGLASPSAHGISVKAQEHCRALPKGRAGISWDEPNRSAPCCCCWMWMRPKELLGTVRNTWECLKPAPGGAAAMQEEPLAMTGHNVLPAFPLLPGNHCPRGFQEQHDPSSLLPALPGSSS